ncbi:MAG: LapA family protein [Gammaproteobacteria bacterium]
MKRIIIFTLLLLVAILGLSFALMNAEPVTLNYYFGKLQAPLSLVLVIALAFGAVMGVLASMWVVITQKREMAKLRKAAKLTEKEITNLRSLPMQDSH